LTVFENKKIKDEKIIFINKKIGKKSKRKKLGYFHEIHTKKVCSKMDQQQNGPQPNGSRHKVMYAR